MSNDELAQALLAYSIRYRQPIIYLEIITSYGNYLPYPFREGVGGEAPTRFFAKLKETPDSMSKTSETTVTVRRVK